MADQTLRVTSGPAAGTTIDLEGDFTFGRDMREAGALGGDPEISRRHARITTAASGELMIEDLGSTNGTIVNGHRITAPTPIRPGDRIELGGSTLELTGQAGAQPTRIGAPPVAAPAPQPHTPAAAAAAPRPLPPRATAEQHPATSKKGGSKPIVAVLGVIVGLLIGGAIAAVAFEGDDEAGASDEPAADGTLYTLSNGFAPKYKNSVLAFSTTKGSLLPMRLREYPTGGTGARNINLNLAIDGEQEINHDPERDLLFAVNPGSDSIAVFKVASDGALSAVEGSPFRSGGIAPISTGVAGDTLLAVNKGHDGVRKPEEEVATLTQFKIGDGGELSAATDAIPLPNGTNPTQVLVTRGGKLAIVTLERGNAYLTFERQDDGTFQKSGETPITDKQRQIGQAGAPGGPPAGSGGPPAGGGGGPPAGGGGGPPAAPPGGPELGSIPQGALGMTEHPKAPVVYSELPNFSLLMVHEYDDSGALKFVRGVPIPKGFLACWAKVSADGRFLYVSNTGDHTVAVFDASDPRNPKHLESHAVPGPGGVASMQVDDEAKSLYALDHFDPLDLQPGDSNRMHAFQIGADGKLSGGDEGSVRLPVGADVSPIGALWLSR